MLDRLNRHTKDGISCFNFDLLQFRRRRVFRMILYAAYISSFFSFSRVLKIARPRLTRLRHDNVAHDVYIRRRIVLQFFSPTRPPRASLISSFYPNEYLEPIPVCRHLFPSRNQANWRHIYRGKRNQQKDVFHPSFKKKNAILCTNN